MRLLYYMDEWMIKWMVSDCLFFRTIVVFNLIDQMVKIINNIKNLHLMLYYSQLSNLFRRPNRLDHLPHFRHHLRLDISLELRQAIPLRPQLHLIHILKLLNRTKLMWQFLHHIIFQLFVPHLIDYHIS